MKTSGLGNWAKQNLEAQDLENLVSGNGDVGVLSEFPDLYAEFESEIDECVMTEAESFGLESADGYVMEKYSSEMESGDLDEVRVFKIRCALEFLLSEKE